MIRREWGQRLVRSWGEGWFEAAGRIGDKIARLVGAAEGEVILADSTSVNLYKLTLAALAARPDRQTILTDDLNFPSDLYILQSAAALTGRRVRVIPAADGIFGPAEAICAAIDDDTALVSLSHTVFKSGYVYDMAAITAAAHRAGALALWDLSHSCLLYTSSQRIIVKSFGVHGRSMAGVQSCQVRSGTTAGVAYGPAARSSK